MKKEDVVFPGDFLTTEEEFSPGKNTYEDEGKIYSATIGEAAFDSREKTVAVKKPREVSMIKTGDVVFGEVGLIKSAFVSVNLIPQPGSRTVIHQTIATLPVRNMSRGFVKDAQSCFRIGDIIKAKVATVNRYGVDLRTDEPDLGVIKSFCAKCRKPLHLFGRDLKCLKCGATEGRKASSEYLLK